MPVEEQIEYSTMRVPKDVIRMIGVLATLDGKSIAEFSDSDLREWATKKYKARIAREGHELGGEGG